jgi:hypothetical protein
MVQAFLLFHKYDNCEFKTFESTRLTRQDLFHFKCLYKQDVLCNSIWQQSVQVLHRNKFAHRVDTFLVLKHPLS